MTHFTESTTEETNILPKEFLPAEEKFREIYPPYNPGAGMSRFLEGIGIRI